MDDLSQLRPLLAFSVILLCILGETFKPKLAQHYKTRLKTNIILYIIDILFLRVLFPIGIFNFAEYLYSGPKLISFLGMGEVVSFIFAIIILDLAIYWQHRVFHVFNFLWKFHAIHHSDHKMDFSTGFRFHPGEIVISALYKTVVLIFLGPGLVTFIVYEIILHSMALFNHSNLKLGKGLDSFLRYILVTPSMHTPHHNAKKEQHNTNYGNFLSVWDRIFGSYNQLDNKEFGLDDISVEQSESVKTMLLYPFMPEREEE